MRDHFEKTLNIYNELAKGQILDASKDSQEKDMDLAGAVEWATKSTAERRIMSQEAQKRILAIQVEKQEIMQRLDWEIENLDAIEKQKDDRSVIFENNQYYFINDRGDRGEVDLGEIMTDGEWGINYHLDSKTVPRNIRKRYVIEKHKRELRSLLDDQILVDETETRLADKRTKETYQIIMSDKERVRKMGEGVLSPGLISEKMVRNFLKKVTYNCPGVSFGILEADVSDDVERKCDFYIQRVARYQKVKVDADEKIENIGIQFTTLPEQSDDAETQSRIEKKKKQVEKQNRERNSLSEIVLISVPAIDAKGMFKRWDGMKSAGGPDKFWGRDVKREIFRKIMSKLFDPAEIEKQLEAVEDRL